MNVSVVHGDCLDVMRGMDEASVDAIVTDPPYGLGFMGKDWDTVKVEKSRPPSADETDAKYRNVFPRTGKGPAAVAFNGPAFQAWCEEWATECLRVLKPGGYMLAFGGTRTWHRLAVAIEDAGFEIRDSIAWLHGQGFPKGRAGLKPAHEPIVVARKRPAVPRAGLLQIDACRIGTGADKDDERWYSWQRGSSVLEEAKGMHTPGRVAPRPEATVGRWPANVVLDETQAHALDQQTGTLHAPGTSGGSKKGAVFGSGFPIASAQHPTYADTGGASRFMYVAKAAKKERPVVNGVSHATVKPLTLMRWLVRLVTPPSVPTLVCSVCDRDVRRMWTPVSTKADDADPLRPGMSPAPSRETPQDATGSVPNLRGADHGTGADLLLDPVPRGGTAATAEAVSTVRRGLHSPSGVPEVLLEGVRGSGDGIAEEVVRGVRGDVPATGEREPVLFADLCGESGGSGEAQGSAPECAGVCDGVRAGTPDGDEDGLHPAASAHHGGTPRADATARRSRASQEREQDGQSRREPSGIAEGSSRPDTEATSEADRMSALRGDDRGFGTCADCGGALVRQDRPGVVLDPFAGSGTTVEAAILEGFAVIGIERDAEYLPLIDARIARNDPTLDLGDGGAA